MNRRILQRIFLCWAIFNLCILFAGCTTAWTSEASSIISLLIPAIQAALGILAAFGVGLSPAVMTAVNTWGQEAQAALAQVKTLIDQYNTAEATAKPGILTEIQNALSVISSNLATILPTIHVTDPTTQAKILSVVQAIADEVSALIGLVPAIQGKVTSHDELKSLMAALKSPKEFKEDFNSKTAEFGKEYMLP
jgi:hypothetical protein